RHGSSVEAEHEVSKNVESCAPPVRRPTLHQGPEDVAWRPPKCVAVWPQPLCHMREPFQSQADVRSLRALLKELNAYPRSQVEPRSVWSGAFVQKRVLRERPRYMDAVSERTESPLNDAEHHVRELPADDDLQYQILSS